MSGHIPASTITAHDEAPRVHFSTSLDVQIPSPKVGISEKFWSRVRIAGPDQCWLWTGGSSCSTSASGKKSRYGCVRAGGRSEYAHRLAYMLTIGPIPEGMTIDHVLTRGCSSKLCCNPAHLEAVTRSENTQRFNRSRVKCNKGHDRVPMTGLCPICSERRRAFYMTSNRKGNLVKESHV
jgi:hypothetical protein